MQSSGVGRVASEGLLEVSAHDKWHAVEDGKGRSRGPINYFVDQWVYVGELSGAHVTGYIQVYPTNLSVLCWEKKKNCWNPVEKKEAFL